MFLIRENKHTSVPDTYHTSNDYTSVTKLMKITQNSRKNRQKTQKAEKYKNLVSQKKRSKMRTCNKSVLNKIMATHK